MLAAPSRCQQLQNNNFPASLTARPTNNAASMTYLLRWVFQCIQRDGCCPPHLVMGVCQETVEGHKDTLRYILQTFLPAKCLVNNAAWARSNNDKSCNVQGCPNATCIDGNILRKECTPGKCYQAHQENVTKGLVQWQWECIAWSKNTARRLNRKSPVLPYISLGKHLSPSFISKA